MKSNLAGKNIYPVEVLNISKHGFWIFVHHSEYFLPFAEFPWFKEATIAALLNVELLHPHHLNWPDLDVDLELESIHSPEKYPLIYQESSKSHP